MYRGFQWSDRPHNPEGMARGSNLASNRGAVKKQSPLPARFGPRTKERSQAGFRAPISKRYLDRKAACGRHARCRMPACSMQAHGTCGVTGSSCLLLNVAPRVALRDLVVAGTVFSEEEGPSSGANACRDPREHRSGSRTHKGRRECGGVADIETRSCRQPGMSE